MSYTSTGEKDNDPQQRNQASNPVDTWMHLGESHNARLLKGSLYSSSSSSSSSFVSLKKHQNGETA